MFWNTHYTVLMPLKYFINALLNALMFFKIALALALYRTFPENWMADAHVTNYESWT